MDMTNRIRMLGVGVVAPLLIGLVGELIVLLSMPDLPDPIATHWGLTGAADGFGSVVSVLVLLPVVVVGYSVFAYVVTRSPDRSFTVNQRLILSIGPYLATLLTILLAGSVIVQRGLTDARDVPSILPLLGLGFGVGLLAAIAAWFLLPAHTPLPDLEPEQVPAMALADTQRATWTRVIEPSRSVGIVLSVLLGGMTLGLGTALWLFAPVATFALYLGIMLVVLLLVASTMFWRATIDATGLRVRSALGVPRIRVPIGDIDLAGVVQVDPAREFGGWGIRWAGRGRLGIIMRKGEALEVRRKNGTALVVTVADARTAAALLNSLAQRVQ